MTQTGKVDMYDWDEKYMARKRALQKAQEKEREKLEAAR